MASEFEGNHPIFIFFSHLLQTFFTFLEYDKNIKRKPLINEVEIDVAGKIIEKILEQAVNIIETTCSKLEYEYEKPSKDLFYYWVFTNGLR